VTLEALETAVRAWIVAAGVAGGIPTPAAKVIIGDQPATRPPLPYVMVRVLSFDRQDEGEDEGIVRGHDPDPPTWEARGRRASTVSLNAYGAGGAEWLRRAGAMLLAPSIRVQLEEAGIAVRELGDLQNLTGLLDERNEIRWQRDVDIAYELDGSDSETVIPLENVGVQATLDDRVENYTIEVA
jgi:hypothetical protein